MLATMVYRDTEVDPVPHVPDVAWAIAPPDWRRQCEQALERAEAAEGRAEELKSAELSARTDLGFYKSHFQAARRKRLEAVEDAKQARREAKALRREVDRLRRAVQEADADLRKALGRSRRRKTALDAVTKENARLHRTVRRLRRRTGTQETVIAKLRATRAVLSKALHGRRSEMRERPGAGRPRWSRSRSRRTGA